MRVAYFDLETSDLKGDFGRLLCASILCHDGVMRTFRQDDFVARGLADNMADDRSLAITIRDELEKHNLISGWYSKGFDVSFLNTRLVQNGERRLKPILHLDPCWYYRGWRGLSTTGSSLKKVSQFYGYEEKQEIPAQVWVAARVGDREAMDLIVERCESDVRILRDIAERTIDEGLVKTISVYP